MIVEVLVALVIGHPIAGVTCGDTGDRYGWYVNPPGLIVLSEVNTCPGFKPHARPSMRGLAWLSIVHEAEHAAGIMDERAADAAAIRDLPKVLQALRVSDWRNVVSWAKIIRAEWEH